jgi:hypothetical protein
MKGRKFSCGPSFDRRQTGSAEQEAMYLAPRFLLGLAMFALGNLANAQATLQIMPASPRYQEPVYARISPSYGLYGYFIYGASVSMSGTNINIALDGTIDLGTGPSFDVELGRFPAGNYTVQVQSPGGLASAQFTVGSRMPQGANNSGEGTVPAVNFSGMWWSEFESGWGLNILQGPTNQLFATWFVYDAAGMPTWYTLELGTWHVNWIETEYSGSIYRYTGPYFATTFDPNKVVGTLIGTGTLEFGNFNSGRLIFTIAGNSTYKWITRLPIQ